MTPNQVNTSFSTFLDLTFLLKEAKAQHTENKLNMEDTRIKSLNSFGPVSYK